MKLRIKTASSFGDIAAICMMRNETGQLVVLTYSAGNYIAMEYVGLDILTPLFPVENPFDLDKFLKINAGEKDLVLNVTLERLVESDMVNILDKPEYSVFYRKNKKYYDLVKFQPESNDDDEQIFIPAPNMMTMQEVFIDHRFDLNSILDRIQKVGVKNLTKMEREFLQQVSAGL